MNLSGAYYEPKFENGFLRAMGEELQTFLEPLMGLVSKSDFTACRPWGNQGDRKNDGFLKTERRLFRVYAPNEMDAANAKAKSAGAGISTRGCSSATRALRVASGWKQTGAESKQGSPSSESPHWTKETM